MNKELKKFYEENSDHLSLSPEASKRVKDKIFSNLHNAPEKGAPVSFVYQLRHTILKGYVLAPLVILLFISGTAYASADSLPGDPLYPIKLKIESARVLVTPNETTRLELQEDYAQRRIDELEKINQKVEIVNKPDTTTAVEIDEDQVSSHGKSEENIQRGRFHQEQARREAINAGRKLEQKQDQLEDIGKAERAQQLEERLNKLKDRLENHRGKSQENEKQIINDMDIPNELKLGR